MGNQAGTLNNDEIGVLGKRSHFTEIEIKALFTRFKKEVSPHSGISKIEFQTTLSNQFGLSDSFLQNLLFGMFDVDGDNQISFEEFLKAFSILSRGTADEKLEFSFRMYDPKKSGFIEKAQLQEIVENLYKYSTIPLVPYNSAHLVSSSSSSSSLNNLSSNTSNNTTTTTTTTMSSPSRNTNSSSSSSSSNSNSVDGTNPNSSNVIEFTSSQVFVDYFFQKMDHDGDGKVSLEDYKIGAMKNPDMISSLQLFA